MQKAKLEYLGEDREFPGSKIWRVEAIHVTTTRNRRKFTKMELNEGARSLSFRPLNINHDSLRKLPYHNESIDILENTTLPMRFNTETNTIEGKIRVSDSATNAMIETGRINTVSIEQIPTNGETCDEVLCEQHGVVFIGLALLESDVLPGDPNARIIKNESVQCERISELIVPDAQRQCKQCTDFEMCKKCSHKHSEFDEILEACLAQKQIDTPEMPMDMRVVSCLEELNRVDGNDDSMKQITITLNETFDKIKTNVDNGVVLAEAIESQNLRPEMAHYFYRLAKEKWQGIAKEKSN